MEDDDRRDRLLLPMLELGLRELTLDDRVWVWMCELVDSDDDPLLSKDGGVRVGKGV